MHRRHLHIKTYMQNHLRKQSTRPPALNDKKLSLEEIKTMLDTFSVPYFEQDRSEEELTEYVTGQILEFLQEET